jgi:hypothetical protein
MLCIGYAQSATDEGFASTKRDPSPGFAEFTIGRRFAPTRWRNHPLPQGERVRDGLASLSERQRDLG